MMRSKTIISQHFNETFVALKETMALFNDELFNKVPFDGSWTPGQVVEHIILSSSGFAKILYAEVAPTDREIEELVPRIKSDFLNFSSKMKSPDFISPAVKAYDQFELLSKVEKISKETISAISALDLNQTCLAFELPGYGFLTRWEAVYFVIYHTQRHVHQLREMHRFFDLS